ncbi:MAG: type VI secretion system tube protein Hcp [Myxococcota bacterium]
MQSVLPRFPLGPFRSSLIALVALTCASVAHADLGAYLQLTIAGEPVPGGVVSAGHEGTIRVRSVSLAGFAPVTTAGAVLAPQSRPVTFLMEVDRSAPELLAAWANNSLVDEATFEFYASSAGPEVHLLTLTLNDARVASYALTSSDSLDAELVDRPTTVLVSLTYGTALLRHEPSSSASAISWQPNP